MKYLVSNIVKATWQDKPYLKASLKNEAGETYDNIAFWNNEITEESTEVEGELTKNDKGYWKFVGVKPTNGRKPNMDRMMDKKADLISEAQERKAHSIHEAQERTAWTWAKYSACELYANDRIGSKLDNEDEVAAKINEFANRIYHMEPTPF